MGCRQKYRYTYSHCDCPVPSSSSQVRHLKRRSHVAPLRDNHFHGNQSSSMQVFDATPLSKNAKGEYSNPFLNFFFICGINIALLTLTYNWDFFFVMICFIVLCSFFFFCYCSRCNSINLAGFFYIFARMK